MHALDRKLWPFIESSDDTQSMFTTVEPFRFTAALVCVEFQSLSLPAWDTETTVSAMCCDSAAVCKHQSHECTGSCPPTWVRSGAICASSDGQLPVGRASRVDLERSARAMPSRC